MEGETRPLRDILMRKGWKVRVVLVRWGMVDYFTEIIVYHRIYATPHNVTSFYILDDKCKYVWFHGLRLSLMIQLCISLANRRILHAILTKRKPPGHGLPARHTNPSSKNPGSPPQTRSSRAFLSGNRVHSLPSQHVVETAGIDSSGAYRSA